MLPDPEAVISYLPGHLPPTSHPHVPAWPFIENFHTSLTVFLFTTPAIILGDFNIYCIRLRHRKLQFLWVRPKVGSVPYSGLSVPRPLGCRSRGSHLLSQPFSGQVLRGVSLMPWHRLHRKWLDQFCTVLGSSKVTTVCSVHRPCSVLPVRNPG